MTGRAICYCEDCQALARFLGRADETLDADGGSDIIATLPRQLRFEQGLDSLACMSLSERGLLRWYAACCKTPIGNTPRDSKISYVGLLHNGLSSQPLEPPFGPARARLNTGSASRPIMSTPWASIAAILKLMTSVVPARLTGRYRENAFFDAASGQPLKPPQVLSPAERSALKRLRFGAERGL